MVKRRYFISSDSLLAAVFFESTTSFLVGEGDFLEGDFFFFSKKFGMLSVQFTMRVMFLDSRRSRDWAADWLPTKRVAPFAGFFQTASEEFNCELVMCVVFWATLRTPRRGH